MTYFQIERMAGVSEGTMTSPGYAPVAANTIRLDEQSRTGFGWEANKISGLGLSPVSITASPRQSGSAPRFVRRLERNIDVNLHLHTTDRVARSVAEAKLTSVLSGECIFRMCESDGNVGIALPASYQYLRVFYAGGGTYTLGDGTVTDEAIRAMVITLRAHQPDWKNGGS